MSRPAINRAVKQHSDLDDTANSPGRAMLRGKRQPVEVIEVSGALRDFLNERLQSALAGRVSAKSFDEIVDEALAEGVA